MKWLLIFIWGILLFTDALWAEGNYSLEFLIFYLVKPAYYYFNRLQLRFVVLKWRQWLLYLFLTLGITYLVIFQLPDLLLLSSHLTNSLEFNLYNTIVILLLLITSSARTIVPDWYNGYLVTKALEEQNLQQQIKILETEFAVSRTLINPHTLANELTYIQSLVIKQDGNSIQAISLLSGMMRNYLSTENRGLVTIKKEIENINVYLEYRSKISLLPSISCQVKGVTEQELNILIPALCFIPIVENMFKHGSINQDQLPEVTMKRESGLLIFSTKNYVDNVNQINNEALKGFGLTSVKEAADLFFDYSELNITKQEKKVITELKFKPND